ncbi:hypothetical protein [Lewinella sp. IMCC34191]|uniref:capsular polysaccharide export protein, LipB/KpsS family n=1 Tax=Lewinella sp. IMCC34191 TaxID=2259172 RepID=UPI000E22EB54|nr:hypothetical protein [Lewinella sp. IMCC34191]
MNWLFHGFGADAVAGLVERITEEYGEGRHFWIRDNLGQDRITSHSRLTVIDHHAALTLTGDELPVVRGGEPMSEAIFELYTDLKPTVIKMMDRLDRYGPARSYPQRESLYRRQFLYWLAFLREYQIEAFVGSNLPHEITDFLIAELLRVLSVRRVTFYQWTPDIVLPLNDYRQLPDQKTRPAAPIGIADGEIVERVNQRIQNQQRGGESATPFYMQADRIRRQKRKREAHWLRRATSKVRGIWTATGLRYAYYLLIEKNLLLPRRDRQFEEHYRARASAELPLDVPFIYLALHYQPEATTSPLGEAFVEQYRIVDLLLAAFPENVSIYIKEHPNQRYIGRGDDYFARFPSSTRIRFAAMDFSSADLVEHAIAVATVSGTVGFESLWKGKPVLLFGYTYYGGAPETYRIQNMADARLAAAAVLGHSAAVPNGSPEVFTRQLLERVIPANIDTYYHDNSVEGLPPEHNVRILSAEILARLSLPAPRRPVDPTA